MGEQYPRNPFTELQEILRKHLQGKLQHILSLFFNLVIMRFWIHN